MMAEEKVRRGCIYLVALGPDGGPEHAGRSRKRPVLVVQNDLGNLSADTTIVVALSSRVPSRLYPFHVMLPAEILGSPGIIMCEQIWTVSLERIAPQALAECPRELMDQVDAALRLSLGLSAETGGR
ncbi:MAG: type II toxin-antitoxin system PemK/MazF family toxin [bacterium]